MLGEDGSTGEIHTGCVYGEGRRVEGRWRSERKERGMGYIDDRGAREFIFL